jgi:peptidoglycan/xylan/chitin deacetylase (PgdA/CDA1 family)
MGAEMRAVLTFHSIDSHSGPLSFPAAGLERLLDALDNARIPVLDLDQLLGADRGVALTFDDGISSVFSSAMPILRDRKLLAHVFVITRWVGGDNRWPGQPADATSFQLMDWGQLGAIQAAGFRIEGHTGSHPDLRLLSDAAVEAEMEEADATIEERLGRRPRYFAYPYGFHDARVRAVAKKRYAASFTTKLDYLHASAEFDAIPRLDAHYLRSPALVRALPGKAAHAYIGLRRQLRRFRGH